MPGLFKFIWITYGVRHNWRNPPDLWSGEYRGLLRRQHRRAWTKDTKTASPYIPWNNSTTEKNSIAEPGIVPRTY